MCGKLTAHGQVCGKLTAHGQVCGKLSAHGQVCGKLTAHGQVCRKLTTHGQVCGLWGQVDRGFIIGRAFFVKITNLMGYDFSSYFDLC